MSLDEVFDVFNEQMIQTGTASRKHVHAQGLWHQTFHCWIISRGASGGWKLLLQLRHGTKDTYPNMLDVSCAGHLLAGETVRDGTRELEEELGLIVPIQDLSYCGMVPEQHYLSEQVIDREFIHTYIYPCEQPLKAYHFQKSEISGLFLVSLTEFTQLFTGEKEQVTAEGIIYNEDNDELQEIHRVINKDQIVWNSPLYYETLLAQINKLNP